MKWSEMVSEIQGISEHLNVQIHKKWIMDFFAEKGNGEPAGIWTPDHTIISRALHQAKLRARKSASTRDRTGDQSVNSRSLYR